MPDKQYKTSQTLLLRARNSHDKNAWNEFSEAYRPFIYHVLKCMQVHQDDIDDLHQDILIRLWKKLALYDSGKGKFRSWLSFVVRNIVLNSFQKSETRIEKMAQLAKHYEDNAASHTEVEKMIEREWKTHLLKLALENIQSLFSGKAVEAFELSLQGQNNTEIALNLKLTLNSVKALKNRVKIRYVAELKRLINNFEEL
ncbi:MAG: sigma-70 family RNA polymerase sigma factor [Lentisphaeraceae bacterium]|nr:sigma-70 family RNA polymerase sigma factor [Lentisphaeraceae bacterium]